MDPQTAWEQLRSAVLAEDWETTRERAQSLLDWLARGGFPPVTSAQDAVVSNKHRDVAMEFCHSALRRAADG